MYFLEPLFSKLTLEKIHEKSPVRDTEQSWSRIKDQGQ